MCGSSVGLVGCGRWGRNILRDLVALGCQVVVVDPDQEAQRAAELGGATAVYDDVHTVPATEGVVLATPATTHAAIIDPLLEREVPVFIEKPLTTDSTSARAIEQRASERVFVMDKWRYHPGVRALAQIARSGELGAVNGLSTIRVQPTTPHEDVDCVWTLTPHDLSIALEVLGEIPEPIEATGEHDDVEATGLVAELGTERGAWHRLEVSARSPEKERRIELHCEQGVAVLADGGDEVVTITRFQSSGAEQRESRPARGELPLLAELRAFVAHLGGGPPPRSSAAEGARAVEVIERLHELAGFR